MARLRAVVATRQPLPDDLADWLFHALSEAPELLRLRNELIREVVRERLSGSPWRRCNRLIDLVQARDPLVLDLIDLGCNIPSHWRVIYRIAYQKNACGD